MEAGQKESKSLRSLYVRVLNCILFCLQSLPIALRNQNSGVDRPLNQSTGPAPFQNSNFFSFICLYVPRGSLR